MTRIVIMGGGPAGYEAALVAAQHGANVTVIERDGVGGACVLYDCVPSKTFIASAGGRTAVREAGSLGVMVDTDKVEVDIAVVHGRVNGLALAQSVDVRSRLEAEGVQILEGTAALADSAPGLAEHVVAVTAPDGTVTEHTAEVVLIATGARRVACLTLEGRLLVFALDELKFFSRELRIVGVYPAHPFRATFSERQD